MFFDRATGQIALRGGCTIATAVGAILTKRCSRGNVWDLLGVGVLAADLGNADVTSFAGLGEGVVAAVKVLALLQIDIRHRLWNWRA